MAILREKQFCGSYTVHYIVVDERVVVALKTGQHTDFQLAPGSHTLTVVHHVIEGMHAVGGYDAAVPVGFGSGRYGMSVTEQFAAESNYYFLIRSKCWAWDENDRVTIEGVENWPEGMVPDPKDYIEVGSDAVGQPIASIE